MKREKKCWSRKLLGSVGIFNSHGRCAKVHNKMRCFFNCIKILYHEKVVTPFSTFPTIHTDNAHTHAKLIHRYSESERVSKREKDDDDDDGERAAAAKRKVREGERRSATAKQRRMGMCEPSRVYTQSHLRYDGKILFMHDIVCRCSYNCTCSHVFACCSLCSLFVVKLHYFQSSMA